ncbi:MAG: hypothetical protein CL609_06850 [Anaerolineaceae bacterium]|nr:hypothetical protein [Anaerolineaceae bacterium]
MFNKYFGLKKISIGKNKNVFVEEKSINDYRNLIFSIQNIPSKNSAEPVDLGQKFKNLVSIVLVTYNSEIWLDSLIKSINESEYFIKEVVIVDNGSRDQTIEIIREEIPNAKLIVNENGRSLASAINLGIHHSSAKFLFIINPDVTFSKKSLLYLLKKAATDKGARIVSPKLMLMDNPQFINGVGNFVGPFYWGYDCGLGHLDVGQFDEIKTLRSGCFAAIMVPREIIDSVGLVDEAYELYYEDVDWCLRARDLGHELFFEPNAIVYHAYIGHQAAKNIITPNKLLNVTYGRLRLIKKMGDKQTFIRFLVSYFIFDLLYCGYSLVVFRFKNIKSIIKGWKKFLSEYKEIFSNPKINNKENLFGKHEKRFFPRVKNGLPVLTSAMIKEGKYQ